MNERFTDIADAVSVGVSHWIFTTTSIVLLIAWTLFGAFFLGPGWFTSQTWNFPLNTVTTAGEWLLEGFILISTARVEKRNWELNQTLLSLMNDVKTLVEREEREIVAIETTNGAGHKQRISTPIAKRT